MAVYLVNILLILVWRGLFTKKRFADPKKFFCGAASFQWILISGLRDWTVGADTLAYANAFESLKQTPWRTVLENLFGYIFQGLEVKDPGYKVVTKLFQVLFPNYQIFLIAIAILVMVPMARFIYKYSASPCTSFILFSTLFYSFYAITGHRQTIATALIVFYGYDLIRERKFWRFALVALAAFLIHKSSLVFVPFYFLSRIRVTKLYTGFFLIATVAAAALGRSLYGPIATWIGYGDEMIYYEGGGAELYATLLCTLCLITMFLYPRIRNHRPDAQHLFHAVSMALMTGMLVIQNQGFMRIQQYYSLFLMVTIPEVINTVKREYRLFVYILFGMVMILYLIRNNPQYSFFFM